MESSNYDFNAYMKRKRKGKKGRWVRGWEKMKEAYTQTKNWEHTRDRTRDLCLSREALLAILKKSQIVSFLFS